MNDFPATADGCAQARRALTEGTDTIDWDLLSAHLSRCADCGAAMARFSNAVDEQFAATMLLDDALAEASLASPVRPAPTFRQPEPIPFAPRPLRPAGGPRGSRRRAGLLGALGGVAVAAALLLIVLVALKPGSGGSAAADRRPQFVPSLQVLPARADNVYYAGEQVQVCLSINQPSRVVLTVLEGQTTFTLYDANSDPGSHCFPERITSALRSRAVLRTEVFYGSERVARQDAVLLPAVATPAP